MNPHLVGGDSWCLVGVIVLDLVLGELLGIDGAPGVDDVSQHEGHEQRYVEHRGERELARAGVLDRERRLEIGCRGIVGGVVPGAAEEQGKYGEYGADACGPDAADITLGEDGLADAVEHEYDSDEQHDEKVPHFDEVGQVLIGLHVNDAELIDGIAVLQ